MPSFTRPGSSVIDYNAVTGDSVTTAAQKQDIALNDLYTNIVDGTASVKGIVQLGTTAATAALGNHLHTGTYAPAAEGVTNGNTHDHTGGDGAQIAYSGLSGLPTLGTAAAVDTGTGAGDVPVLDAGGKIAVGVLPSITGTDPTARDNAVFNSFLNQIDLGRASGAIPSGYMHLFLTDELVTKTNATYVADGDYYTNQTAATARDSTPSEGATSPGDGNSFVDRNLTPMPNNATISKISMYSSSANSGTLYIVERTGAGAYTVVYSQAYSHPGGGWADISLTTPHTVPASGAYLPGVHSTTFGGSSWVRGNRTYKSGALSGSVTMTEDTGSPQISLGYVYSTTPTNMTLIPTAITAGTAPETVNLYMLHKAVDATTLNTDLRARVSRDNGANWSAHVTLAEVCQYDADYKLLKGTADLSALASGTSVKWEITTLNTKAQRVRAAAMILNS